jgi:hypothetical protein
VRYAHWDLSQVYLTDSRSGDILCRLYPQDKQSNARGVRRPLKPLAPAIAQRPAESAPARTDVRMAPLLAKLINQQNATGLPPAYLPKDQPAEES